VSTVLRNGRTPDGSTVDVVIDEDGRVGEVLDAGTAPVTPGDTVHDLGGLLLLPACAEPHAHLDKAFTADDVPNPAGDLPGAIAAWGAHRAGLSVDEIAGRAARAVRAGVANGVTAFRTHVDLGRDTGLRSVEALVRVREQLRALISLEIVPLVSPDLGHRPAERDALVREAMAIGADTIGGAPYIEDQPWRSIDALVALAVEHGAGVDLHIDETLDASVLTLRHVIRAVEEAKLHGRAAASHCVSLAMQPEAVQAEVAEACAAAGVAVVTLPQTNLYLQARGVRTAAPRGLTAIAALRAAGVTVAGGGDNIQDPFNVAGRADPLETASLLVTAGHLTTDDAYASVSTEARRLMGLDAAGPVAGAVADLLAIDAPSVRAAVAGAPATRLVFRAGRLVARTESRTTFAGD
jgi:cytosine deaminase